MVKVNPDYIDWYRIAKPQPDFYDTPIYHAYAQQNYGWIGRTIPTSPVVLGLATAFTTIAVLPSKRHMTLGSAEDVGSILTQEWADAQTEFLTQWKAGSYALFAYLDEFWPWRAATGGRGCSSGHVPPTANEPMHAVYVTMNDMEGCAQGIYHEFAHLRLRTLGIAMETHDSLLLTNADTELYNSPVRFDVKRPMSAVIQGLYAWLMFVENDYQIHSAGKSREEYHDYTLHNLAKIENGLNEVKNCVKTTEYGEQFIAGMLDWGWDLLDRCHKVAIAELPLEVYSSRCKTARA